MVILARFHPLKRFSGILNIRFQSDSRKEHDLVPGIPDSKGENRFQPKSRKGQSMVPKNHDFMPTQRTKPKDKLVEKVHLHVRAGGGGHGMARKGGVGGKGGDVILQAKKSVTLTQLLKKQREKFKYVAESGMDSKKLIIRGINGEDLIIDVPVGVAVENMEGHTIGELEIPGQKCTIAVGGQGGCPDNNFIGQQGQAGVFFLRPKLVADVVLVGFPCSGRTSLLEALIRQTKKLDISLPVLPQEVGTMVYDDLRQITVAELYQGCLTNIAQGRSIFRSGFIRLCERSKLLVFVVDIKGVNLTPTQTKYTALESIVALHQEFSQNLRLLEKPAILVLSKTDTDREGGTKVEEIKTSLENVAEIGKASSKFKHFDPRKMVLFDEVIAVSAKTGENIDFLKNKTRELLDEYATTRRDSASDKKSKKLANLKQVMEVKLV